MPRINPVRVKAGGVSDSRDDDRGGRGSGRGGRSSGRTAVGFALAVLVASLRPGSWVAPGGGASDGGAALPLGVGLTDPFHLVGYAVLTVLASRAIGRGRRGILLAAGAAVAFGFGVEVVQAPIPWRSFAWRDAAVNAVGAGIGLTARAVVDAIDAADTIGADSQ